MGILDKAIEERSNTTLNYIESNPNAGYEFVTEDDSGDIALKESTYFRCIDKISKDVAKCNIQIKKELEQGGEKVNKEHYLNDLLKLRPNPFMSINDLIKSTVARYKHEGIAGILISRDSKGNIKDLYPVAVNQIIIDDANIMKKRELAMAIDYSFCNYIGSCFPKDIILLKDFSLDGINTKATKKLLKTTIDTNVKSQNYLNEVFTNGLTNKVLMSCTSEIDDENKLAKLQKKFNDLYKAKGRIFVAPIGMNAIPLNLSLSDAQFEQLKRMSMQQIASAMGVKMSMLGDYKDTNNNSLEQQNIEFLQDTLQPIFTQLEQEMDYKLLTKEDRILGNKIRFNIGTILRTDQMTQANILSTYVKSGIKTPNECRGILGDSYIEGGNDLYMPSGQVSLKQLSQGNVSYSKGGDNDNGEGN